MTEALHSPIRHLLLQVFCLFQKVPAIQISEGAKIELNRRISAIADFNPVATILWASDGTKASNRSWQIVFYDKWTRPYGRVTHVNGIPFIFIQSFFSARLNGATIDYSEGRIVVREQDQR